MRSFWRVVMVSLSLGGAALLPASSAVLFSETGTPDAVWNDDADLTNWMIGHTEQDVINAGWSGTEAESAWLLDPWHNPANRVLAVSLFKLSPDKADAEDSLVSLSWRDTLRSDNVAWTLFCNIGVLHDILPGFTETFRLDLKAQGEIVDSVPISIRGNGFSGWVFMAGSCHEPAAEIANNNWSIEVSLSHLSHANSITVMVDDVFVYESQDIEFIVGRAPSPDLTVGTEAGAVFDRFPLPTISTNEERSVILTWRTIEGHVYDVERSAAKSFGEAVWERIAEGLAHDPSGTISFSDEGAGELEAGYYRIVVTLP